MYLFQNRCTGYRPILDAAASFTPSVDQKVRTPHSLVSTHNPPQSFPCLPPTPQSLDSAYNSPANHSPSPSPALLPPSDPPFFPFSLPSRRFRRRTLRTWAAAPWAPMTWVGARTAPPPGSPTCSATSRDRWPSRAATARSGTCPPRSRRYEAKDPHAYVNERPAPTCLG